MRGTKFLVISYSFRFKIKVTFRHKLRYEIKVIFGEISLKLCQMNWNVVRNNVNVVVDELPSQICNTCSFMLKVQKMTVSPHIFYNGTFILKRREYMIR